MKPTTIVIVEDDGDIRESLRDAFEDAGYAVHSARNGLEGLEVLRGCDRPCAVVLDLIMPVMTGNELYEAMQADPQLADIPVVVSTSDPSRVPSGVPFVRKPINVSAMLNTVKRIFDAAAT